MRLETLLPLGKVDPGLRAPETPMDLGTVARTAAFLEEIGYGGLAVEETKDDPFVVLTLAAAATQRLHLTTAVAIAFPRSPTTMALQAWTQQKFSGGRFTLGLGTQVRGHIRRRYGMEWHPPAPWMRDHVEAMRAVWHTWQTGEKLDHHGEHYDLDLMVPLFDAGPIEHPDIPVHLAAVNPNMCAVAGEVADGVRPHPVCTPSYVAEVMLPAVRRGAARSGRSLADLRVAMKPLVASGRTEEELRPKIRDARARIAFYASTPGYRAAFDHLGLHDLATDAKELSKAQRWEELPDMIDDETLDRFAVIGTYDEIGERLLERYSGVVTDVEFSIAVSPDPEHHERDRETLRNLASVVQGADDAAARAEITTGDAAQRSPIIDAGGAAQLDDPDRERSR